MSHRPGTAIPSRFFYTIHSSSILGTSRLFTSPHTVMRSILWMSLASTAQADVVAEAIHADWKGDFHGINGHL
jgi:hypothetical protein